MTVIHLFILSSAVHFISSTLWLILRIHKDTFVSFLACNFLNVFLLIETTTELRSAIVTELQLSDISDDVGTCWRVLGPKLEIAASKLQNLDEEYKYNRDKANALLLMWRQKEGSCATVGRLADFLVRIGRKSIDERLLGGCRYIPRRDSKSNYMFWRFSRPSNLHYTL